MRKILLLLLVVLIAMGMTACGCDEISKLSDEISESTAVLNDAVTDENSDAGDNNTGAAEGCDVPEYDGDAYVSVNGNEPDFDKKLKTENSFEKYGNLDSMGRCTDAIANLSIDTQPLTKESRGDISSIHPSGWQSNMGWERCHLIGWQLSAENANARNLVTGTHYMNVSGMLPLENKVDDYLERTGNHVLYEVTPYFEGSNRICSGVFMQAESVEDNGSGISFHVYCFNVSPGNEINYSTGAVETNDEEEADSSAFSRVYILNTNTGKFHYPSCYSVKRMSESNRIKVTKSRKELIHQGYSPCGNCNP